MDVTSHVAALKKKHEVLATAIEKEQRSPGADDLRISEMKRQKLRLKEEIGRISGPT